MTARAKPNQAPELPDGFRFSFGTVMQIACADAEWINNVICSFAVVIGGAAPDRSHGASGQAQGGGGDPGGHPILTSESDCKFFTTAISRTDFGSLTITGGKKMLRVRLTRSIFLGGEHAEEGSIHDLPRRLADDLIAQGSAERLNFFSRFLQGLWFFRGRQTSRVTVAMVPEVHEEKKMNRTEKAAEVLERADKLGLHPRLIYGVLAVNEKAPGDPEQQDAIRAEIVKYLPDLRHLVERRELAAHAHEFFGKRILSPLLLLQTTEVMKGVFESASIDGTVYISLETGGRSPSRVTSNAANLLIVLDEEAGVASSPRNDEQKSRHAPLGGG
ncbi:MAG: hypothetical protein JWN63_2291 [Candidatus Acidoferrum typicum]|nr:hypothetical protein [Candidatus Acidoferrum typicum]